MNEEGEVINGDQGPEDFGDDPIDNNDQDFNQHGQVQ